MRQVRTSQSDVAARTTQKVIDSRRLLYFYHVAKAGRFTAAEAVLDVAQSAMSRQIQQLETDLGTQLLERTGHGVRLTPQGQILYRQAETILQTMAATVDELEEARHRPLGSVSVAAPPSFMATYMADVISQFAVALPGVRFRALEASTGAVYDLLASNEVDAAVVLQVGNTARLQVRELAREPLVLIARADHPIAARSNVARAELAGLDLVIPASLHGSRSILSRYLGAEGIPLRSQLEADSLPLTRALVQSRSVCTILPAATCRAELDRGDFVARPLKPVLNRTLYVAHLRDRASDPHLQTLIEAIVATVARPGRAGERATP